MKKLAEWILKLMGWRITHEMAPGVKKAVIIMAPHTANIDFVIGRLGFMARGLKPKIMIKKESFFFPLGIILRMLGAVPLDRGYSAGTIKKITEMMEESDSFLLLITPEGTRKLVKNWKKGFYFIAQQANVPIVLGFLNYKDKTGGFGPLIYPTGDYEADLREIQKFYFDKQAKYPESFNLSPQYRDKDS